MAKKVPSDELDVSDSFIAYFVGITILYFTNVELKPCLGIILPITLLRSIGEVDITNGSIVDFTSPIFAE